MSTGYTPPFFLEQFADQSGKPLSGGSLTFLVAGSTSLPKNIYLDYALQNVADNPWPLDSVGRAAQYYMDSGAYKIIVKDSTGAIIATRDYIDASTGSGGGAVDDHKVMVDAGDPLPGYLQDKIVGSSTITVTDSVVGGGRKILTLEVDESGLSHAPSGLAGGDLAGTYPDPVVKQLTGISTAMVAKTPGFAYPTDPALTGIGAGYIYVNGVAVKAWGAISFAGHIRWSTDNWESSFEDNGLFAHGSSFGRSWNAFSFVQSGADYYWVAGDGTNQSIYMAKHIPANYATNGAILTNAWIKVDYPSSDYVNNRLMPSNVGDIATANGVTCWVGNSSYIGRTTDFSSYTSPAITAYMNTGGIATDGYDTWLVVIKDTGELHMSTGNQATSWEMLTNVVVDGVATGHLPHPKGEQWGSILCSYGTWIAAVYSASDHGTGHISYAYSNDGYNWTTVSNSDIVFFSAASNGVSWFATNPVPNSANPVFQLLISEIPAHKKLIAEQGIAVAGNTNLVDLPNAPFLSTDQYGKIYAGDGTNLGGKVLLDNSDVVKGYLLDKIGVNPVTGLTTTVITQGVGDRKVLLGTTGEVRINDSDSNWDYIENKIIPGAGITITEVSDGSGGIKLSINAKGNSWRLIKYVNANYTVADTDDTLIIRGTGIVITMPTPSAAYEGRIITIRCAGGSNSANCTGSIVGSSSLTGTTKLEFMCYNTGSAFFWVQQ